MKTVTGSLPENVRIETLNSLSLVNTFTEKDFEQITLIVKQVCNAPMAFISLVDERRHWFKSKLGLSATDIHRDLIFCSYTIFKNDFFSVEDASQDLRFAYNPFVQGGLQIRFYAGVPLLSPDGQPVGTLCVVDQKPGRLNEAQISAMKALSNQVTQLLELKSQVHKLKVTEERRLEAEAIESSRLTALAEMAGGMAHEIKNPLAIIKGRTGLLKRKYQSGQNNYSTISKDFDSIEKTIDRIDKIIKGLHTFSRHADQDLFENIALKSIIDSTLELCHEKFTHERIRIKVSCDPQLQLQCRSAQISQILMNLLSNAYDAVIQLPEKHIHICASLDKGFVCLSVQDSGGGIRADIAGKMMQPFFTTKAHGKGTGLGLSTSSSLAASHGGSLRYESNATHTTFVLKIPQLQKSDLKKTA
jgi:two-component system, NtrC family, sensor kinase